MRHPWIAAIVIAGFAGVACAAQTNQSPTDKPEKTVINGRTFDFPVPSVAKYDDDFFNNLSDKQLREFLVGALNTPSPPKKIWDAFGEWMGTHEGREIVVGYLKSRPTPSNADMKMFLAKVKANMIFVKGGTFDMGDFGWLTPSKRPMTSDPLNSPPHKVTLDNYSLMKNRVTYGDYDIYTTLNRLPPISTDGYDLKMRFPNFPAYVTWQQGRDYCQWLGTQTHRPFDIDTEAQYEYAARSGGKWLFLATTFQKLDEILPDQVAFKKFMDKADRDVSPDTEISVPVGTYGENYLGFEDMTGAIKEWVYDWFAPYTKVDQDNPRGPSKRPPTRSPLAQQKSSWGYGNGKVVRAANEDTQGTMSRGDLDPTQPYATVRCAINAKQPWK